MGKAIDRRRRLSGRGRLLPRAGGKRHEAWRRFALLRFALFVDDRHESRGPDNAGLSLELLLVVEDACFSSRTCPMWEHGNAARSSRLTIGSWYLLLMIEIILQWIELVQLTVDLLLSSNRTRSRRFYSSVYFCLA
jgi:hypothetical protein